MNNEHILIKNLKGWSKNDITLFITDEPKLSGDPKEVGKLNSDMEKKLRASYETTKEKRPTDFNGDKVSVKKITRSQGKLKIVARKTDYFTLWGLPHAAPELLKKSNEDFIESKGSDMPCGLYAACMVITSDNKVIMGISSPSHGFGAGRLSFGFEEQSETSDNNLIETAVRGLKEEFGIDITDEDVKVLGMGKSLNIAYLSAYCILKVDLTAQEIATLRKKAIDKNEQSCLLAVPLDEVETLLSENVQVEDAKKYLIQGNLEGHMSLVQHIANIPRWKLIKKYLELQQKSV